MWVFAEARRRYQTLGAGVRDGGCETSNWVLGRRTRSSARAEVLATTRLWFKHVSYLIAFVLFYWCLLRVRFDFSVFLDYDGYEVLDETLKTRF